MRQLLLRGIALAALTTCIGTAALAKGPASPGVAPQYDTTHVYVESGKVDAFVKSFLATFGGESTKHVVATVTPTPSKTTSQLLLTPAGTVSLFGFQTPIPAPFGTERTGYLVKDIDKAVEKARKSGAEIVVATFPDPIGRDAVIRWPGGVNMQLYWHTTTPHYQPLKTIPDNRVYLSPDRANVFVKDFLAFSAGRIVSDERKANGLEIGRPKDHFRRIRLTSAFGNIEVLVTDGHLPYPYGHEMTGYEVADLKDTLTKAETSGATILVQPVTVEGRQSAMVEFPGGYIAEIHQPLGAGK
ncbi:glyoxalase [Allorhizobium sp. BGMRC 0089]|uniref:VOC family protein n=1 Tax=Allorhizobium sonneratiae TaxID=2934936 RepID=UPI0020341C0D|nr:glyoxalase [Allorhizobium sonneratiae]MCM2294624.1 glyoxalase [Allorhizobium sonneratiae]